MSLLRLVLNIANYKIDWYASLTMQSFETGLAVLLLGLAVMIRERGSLVSRLFFLMTAAAGVWLVSFSWMYCAANYGVALWWARAGYLGVCFIPAAVYHLTAALVPLHGWRRKIAWVGWLLAAGFAYVALSTRALIREVHHYSWGYYPRYGWTSLPYLLYFAVFMFASLRLYWSASREAKMDIDRRRSRCFLIAFLTSLAGMVDFLPKFGLAVYPFGYLSVMAFAAIMAWTIGRYHLAEVARPWTPSEIFKDMPGAVFVAGLDGMIRMVNKAACTLLGCRESEMVETPLASMLVPADRGKINFAKPAEAVAFLNSVTLCRDKKGEIIEVELSASPLVNMKGLTDGIVCIVQDARERNRTLRERDRFFLQSPEMFCIIGSDGVFRHLNGAWEKTLGYAPEEMAGRHYLEFMHPEDRERSAAEAKRLASGHATVSFQNRCLCKDGSYRWLSWTASASQENRCFHAVARDITTRSRTAEDAHLKERAQKPAPLSRPAHPVTEVAVAAALAAVYFVAGKLGLKLAYIQPNATTVWPPTGIAFAACLVLGYRIWPGVFLGAFLVNRTTAGSMATSLAIAFGNTLEALVGTALVNRYANGRRSFDRVQDFMKWVILAGLVSTMVSPTIGVTCLSWAGFSSWARYHRVWLTWWLGDVSGNLLVAPFLILWSLRPRPRWNGREMLEAGFLALLLSLLASIVFGPISIPFRDAPLDFLCFPVIVWIAYRFEERATATATLLLSMIALYGTLHGRGPFAGRSPNQSLILLQAFMGVTAVMSLGLACILAERRRGQEALGSLGTDLELRIKRTASDFAEAIKSLGDEIARREEIQDLLSESQERFQLLVEGVKDHALFMLDPAGRVSSWTEAARRIEGYTAQEIIGRNFSCFYPEEDIRSGKPDRLLKTALTEGRVEDEGWRVRKDGSRFWAHVAITALRGEKGVLRGFAKVTRDITERKQAEENLKTAYSQMEAHVKERTLELSRSNAELEQFAYVASHNLQEPIRKMVSYSQLLSRRYQGQLDPGANKFIAYIVDGASRMQTLIQNLLIYSRAGRGELNLKSTELETTLRQVLSDLESAVRESQAVITYDSLPTILADPVQITLLLQNLVSNAIKFHGAEPPRVHIGAERKNGEWIFAVRDHGIGIASEDQERIFGIFQRLHTDKEYPGTGIGLAVCKKIVERHKGRLWLESRLGQGCTFYFSLPADFKLPTGSPAAKEQRASAS